MHRVAPGRRLLGVFLMALASAAAAWACAPASAAPAAEVALAREYAPVLRMTERASSCGVDVPYLPVDVDDLMGNDEIALRGPWDRTNLVGVAPGAQRLAQGLWDYHLDFPGDALRPGCTYVEWEERLASAPTVYAHVATEPGVPGRLALQYWFFYVFNDWNNTHEGDWEMIQLNFDAATPQEALTERPVEVGYSQHSSAERAEWGDGKLQLVGGTHPVVHPAAGSQANFYDSRLYLMRSDAEGLGCDDTRAPSRTFRPGVRTIPSDPATAVAEYPWLGFDGRWGEKHAAFFNGPVGPNRNLRWTHPFTWAATSWRATSFAVPASGLVGTNATDVFCGSIERGSRVLRLIKINPGRTMLVITGIVLLLLWPITRTRWGPSTPRPLAARRAWGQIITAGARAFADRPQTFIGIGLLFIPLALVTTGLQWLLFRATALAPLVDEAGERHAWVDAMALALGMALTLIGFAVVQAATARVIIEGAAGRRVTALWAYRQVLRNVGPLAAAVAIAVAVVLVFNITLVLVPIAVYIVVRWSLLGVVAGAEEHPQPGILRRSIVLTRGNWWRTATIALGLTGLALLIGPAVGVLVLLFTGAAFDFVNLIAGAVYVAALPFAAVVVTYLYFDLRVRHEEAPVEDTLPAGAVPPVPPTGS
ncbi:MAG: hypothetical protein AB7O78_12270 [Thermoleophilia bacterium]